jgi:hypothetical protein
MSGDKWLLMSEIFFMRFVFSVDDCLAGENIGARR